MQLIAIDIYDISNSSREGSIPQSAITDARETKSLNGEHTFTFTFIPYHDDGTLSVSHNDLTANDFCPKLQKKKWIRALVKTNTDKEERRYIINDIQITRQSNRMVYTVSCYGLRYAAADVVVPINGHYSQIESNIIMNRAMALIDGWQVAYTSIPGGTDKRDLDISYPTLLELAQYICDQYAQDDEYYFEVSYDAPEDKNTIRFYSQSEIGNQIDYAITPGHNMLGIERRDLPIDLVNRLYASNSDGTNSLLYSDLLAYHQRTEYLTGIYVYSGYPSYTYTIGRSTGETLALGTRLNLIVVPSTTNTSYPIQGSWQILYKISLLDSSGNIVWGPVAYTSQDTPSYERAQTYECHNIYIDDIPNVNKIKYEYVSTVLHDGCQVDTSVVLIGGFFYFTSDNNAYIENADSQTTYGVIERSTQLDYPRVYNLISDQYRIRLGNPYGQQTYDSTMSGSYSGGLHEGFELIGAPITTQKLRNSSEDIIRHGTYAQKVQCTDIGQGIRYNALERAPFFGKDVPYFALFNLYIESGEVNIKIFGEAIEYRFGTGITSPSDPWELLFDHTTSGTGRVQVRNEDAFGMDVNGACRIELTAVTPNATFYIDSMQISEGYAERAMPFYKTNSADDMKDEAEVILNRNKEPRYVYYVDFLDLPKIEPDLLASNIDTGDQLRVIDQQMGLDEYLRVISYERSLMRPDDVRLELAKKTTPLSMIIQQSISTKGRLIV
jgi:hypothetical protein